MNARNQIELMHQRRKVNALLTVIFVGLLTWVIVEFYTEIQRAYAARKPLSATTIRIHREADSITLTQTRNKWQVSQPYQHNASQVVIEALLMRLKQGCRLLDAPPIRTPEFFADIYLDQTRYQVGELNHASDEVYVKRGTDWLLCDKLIAAMALAPALNFMDKQLYAGELTAIIGEFGRLTDFTGVDLSVLELAPAEQSALPEHAIATLTFEAEDKRSYQTFLSEDSRHLLLFEPQQALIYVIAANPKLNAVLGL